MKNLYSQLFFFASLALFLSCSDAEDEVEPVVKETELTITSNLSHTVVRVGEPIYISVEGLGESPESKKDSTYLVFTGVDKLVRRKVTNINNEQVYLENLPDSATSGPVTIEVGNRKATSGTSLKFGPSIDSLKAFSIATGDTLLLKGFNLSANGSEPRLSFFSSVVYNQQVDYDVEAEILEYSPFHIVFVVPARLANSTFPITLPKRIILSSNGQAFNSNGTYDYITDFYDFEVVNPVLGYTNPKKVWVGAKSVIKALNIPNIDDIDVQFGTAQAPIVQNKSYKDELIVQVPQLETGVYPITLNTGLTPTRPGIGLDIEIIERPVVEISNMKAKPGDTLTLKGADFRDRSDVLMLSFYNEQESFLVCSDEANTCEGYFFDFTENEVKFKVPEGITNTTNVKLTFNGDNFEFGEFTIE